MGTRALGYAQRYGAHVMTSSGQTIRTVIVDDQDHFRHGLRTALEQADVDIEVVGEATTGEEGVELIKRLRPAVAIIDVRMPGAGGISAARAVAAAAPQTHVLMLTVSDEVDDIAQAVGVGAGYLLKDRSLEDIAEAVIALAGGQQWPAETG